MRLAGRLGSQNKPNLGNQQHMKRLPILSVGLALALGAGHAHGQSAQEFEALKKRLNQLESKTSRLEEENKQLLNGSILDKTPSAADKIKLTGPIKELSLYGDIGLRYQWDNSQQQYYVNPKGQIVNENGEQRSRWRFRLRLNADFKLSDNWFGGVGLASNQTPDSGYTTWDGGFQNYGIYISRAFVGWNAGDWGTVIGGKQANPFYTTDLVWDSNINPSGVVEQIKFHKLFGWGSSKEEVVTSTDGKTVATSRSSSSDSPFELTLVAGQLFFDDNNEYNLYSDNKTDAYIFEQQLIASYKFNKDVRATIAPAYLAYNAAKAGPNNVAPFSKNNDGLPAWVGETRDLSILQVPGDVTFKVFGKKTKFIWDFTYNFQGKDRAAEVYGLTGAPIAIKDSSGKTTRLLPGATHSSQDDFAYLVGIQIGENKKKNDWSIFLNYRQVGLTALDPNINEGTWGSSRTNLRGFKGGIAYNFTDFAVAALTYYNADNIRKDLYGGQATGGAKVANFNSSQIIQFDLNVKF